MSNLPALSSQVALTQCKRYCKQQQMDNKINNNVDMSTRLFPEYTIDKQAVPTTQPIIKVKGNNQQTLTQRGNCENDNDFHPTQKI